MKPPGGSTDSLELKMASDKLSEISEDPLWPAAGEFFLEKNTKMAVLSEKLSPKILKLNSTMSVSSCYVIQKKRWNLQNLSVVNDPTYRTILVIGKIYMNHF